MLKLALAAARWLSRVSFLNVEDAVAVYKDVDDILVLVGNGLGAEETSRIIHQMNVGV